MPVERNLKKLIAEVNETVKHKSIHIDISRFTNVIVSLLISS
jgi:hypothetical protein